MLSAACAMGSRSTALGRRPALEKGRGSGGAEFPAPHLRCLPIAVAPSNFELDDSLRRTYHWSMVEFSFPKFSLPAIACKSDCGCGDGSQLSHHLPWTDSLQPTSRMALGERLHPVEETSVTLQAAQPAEDLSISRRTMATSVPMFATNTGSNPQDLASPTWGNRLQPQDPPNDPEPSGNPVPQGRTYYMFKDIDTYPDYKTIGMKPAFCSASQSDVLKDLHYRAYRYALTAQRTLHRMYLLDESTRKIVWNWGEVGSKNTYLWTHKDQKEPNYVYLDGLAAWFGPYSASRFSRVRSIFNALKVCFEKGVNVGGVRYWMRYKCKDVGCGPAPARHLVAWNIDICPAFWTDWANTERWRRARSTTILHEVFHNINGFLKPRDESLADVCEGGWKVNENMCYRDRLWDYDWNNYGKYGDNPRELVKSGFYSVALNNVDNYTCWTLRRYISPWFGEFDLPYPHFGGKNP